MNPTVFSLPESHFHALETAPEPLKVAVTLLDRDNLPIARGTAILPVLLGVGVFWPSCPMPAADGLATAQCFTLPSGEILQLRSLTLCAENPPKYEFWVNAPASRANRDS